MGFKLKHRRARDAMWRYAREINEPLTLEQMLDNATLLSGKRVREARSCGPKNAKSFGQCLKRDSRFEIVGQITIPSTYGYKKVSLWALVKDEEWHTYMGCEWDDKHQRWKKVYVGKGTK